MYVMSIALFNSGSNFVFKIYLFRCNVSETSIFSIILIFLFHGESVSKWKIYSRNMYALTRFELPSPYTHPYAFFMTPPLPLPAYVLYGWPPLQQNNLIFSVITIHLVITKNCHGNTVNIIILPI